MFSLRCLINSACAGGRQLSASLKADGRWTRAFCSSQLRLPEIPQPSTDSKENKDFSLMPPLPGEDSPLSWEGKKFEELPIAHIKATYNNTHIQLTASDGGSLIRTSCGTEGFKNRKKSTPIAAQTAAIIAAEKAAAQGIKYVRVMVKGIGPGRQSAVKGLVMGGLQPVSITDNTPVPHNGSRPRKARRL